MILYRAMGYMHLDEGLIDILAGLERRLLPEKKVLLLDRCLVVSDYVRFKPTNDTMDGRLLR